MSRKMIIPAAGFGRRVGSPEAKEMLMLTSTTREANEPLIAYSLQVAKKAKAGTHVILRKEKENLLRYLAEKNIDYQMVEPTKEWPHTILLSKNFWSETNIVCLPDTEFLPTQIVEQMYCALEADVDIVFATFSVDDPNKWGMVAENEMKKFFHCEKPTNIRSGAKAWGLFGFRKNFGENFLQQLALSTFDHRWRPIDARCRSISLDYFKDLTR